MQRMNMPDQKHTDQHDEPCVGSSNAAGSVPLLLPADNERGKYKAIRGGEKAGLIGVPKNRNPYKNKDRSEWWDIGWSEGRRLADWWDAQIEEAKQFHSQNTED